MHGLYDGFAGDSGLSRGHTCNVTMKQALTSLPLQFIVPCASLEISMYSPAMSRRRHSVFRLSVCDHKLEVPKHDILWEFYQSYNWVQFGTELVTL